MLFATAPVLLAVTAAVTAAVAGPSALPGDRGRPGDGVPMPPPPNAGPQGPRPPDPAAPAPSAELTLKAMTAIAEGCKQFPFGLAIVNAEGVATLIYVPDGAAAWHGYSAVRKAYTAVAFKEPTSQLVKDVQHDTALADKVRSDPNLQAQSGGVPLKVGDRVIGAIGVSGAEPGGHDEDCALIGVNKIKDQLK
jgi:uncharacterized protein GlcG (DUF336 family)